MNKNISLLFVCLALIMATSSLNMTTSALVGLSIAPARNLATLPLGISFLTIMVVMIPISLLMQRYGRRTGFAVGGLSIIAGGLLAAMAIYLGNFELFCLSAVFQGVAMSTAQFYRYAAVEVATDSYKSRAISWVLVGGLAAAFLGPSIARYTRDILPDALFALSYGSFAILGLGVLICLVFLKIPAPDITEVREKARPLIRILLLPTFIVAALCAMIAYGTMNLLMTSTPLAMDHRDFNFDQTATVIQWHIVGMFAPSFFTGHLIHRFGTLPVMAAGVLMLFLCTTLSLTGDGYSHFMISLITLGIGWNFLFIGGTTLITEVHRPSEKGLVQGVNDFLVFSGVASTALISGYLHHHFGWQNMNYGVMPVLLLAAVSIAVLGVMRAMRARSSFIRSDNQTAAGK